MNNPKSSNQRMEKLKEAWPVEKQTKPSCWACFFKPKPKPRPEPKVEPKTEPEHVPQTEIEVLMAQMEVFKSMVH